MAISKKGLRPIKVRDQQFYWKFNEQVFVFPEDDPNSLLVIDFGWYDIWLYTSDPENSPPEFEPKIATPSFVAQSIQFALDHGWAGGKMNLEFKNKSYKIVEL